MTIEEINALAVNEKNGALRKPIDAEKFKKEDLFNQEQILLRIRWFLNEEKEKGIVGCLFRRLVMKKQKGVNSFKGLGTIKHPFKIETEFGSGTFYDVRKGFEKNTYPQWIKQNYCYSNCLQFILLTKVKCKLLSGIGYLEKPFLHSVVLIGDKIIDFNYHIVMSKDLYFKLTKFECLAELDAQKIRESNDFILSKEDVLTNSCLQTVTLNFAFDDVLDYLHDEERQKNQPQLGIN